MQDTYGAAGQFVCLAIVILVVKCLAVAVHGHDVGEYGAGSVVLIRVEEDTEALELVDGAKYRALLCALLGEPECETIAIQSVLTVDLKFELNLLSRELSDMLWNGN